VGEKVGFRVRGSGFRNGKQKSLTGNVELMDGYVRAFSTIYDHLGLAFWAALVFAMGFGSAFVVVRGHLSFLMRFPLWFASKVDRLLSSNRGFLTVFLAIFFFNAAAMFVYMLSGVVEMMPAVIDFLTGMNIGVVFLAKHQPVQPPGNAEPDAEGWDTAHLETVADAAVTSSSPARHAIILIGFLVVTALELPCLWVSIAMGMGLCRCAHPDGAACMTAQEIMVRAYAYLLVIVPLLAVSALAETISVRMMQADLRELGA